VASVIKVDQIQSDTGTVNLASNLAFSSAFSMSGPVTLNSPTIATPTMTGQAVIPSINLTGGQIVFPATQNPSGNANTLDDYEEGTWSPQITGWSGTYSAQFGHYTKVGNLVYVFGRATTNGGTGTFTNNFPGISNFPFAGAVLGSAAKGMWFVVDGTTGLTSSQTASGPLDGPTTGTVAFPNWIVTGGNVNNWPNSKLNAAVNVEYRFFCTYTAA
jgi:hypothetical protein